MRSDELKKQIIEMIQGIDNEELLYHLKEDVIFQANNYMPETELPAQTEQEDSSLFNVLSHALTKYPYLRVC